MSSDGSYLYQSYVTAKGVPPRNATQFIAYCKSIGKPLNWKSANIIIKANKNGAVSSNTISNAPRTVNKPKSPLVAPHRPQRMSRATPPSHGLPSLPSRPSPSPPPQMQQTQYTQNTQNNQKQNTNQLPTEQELNALGFVQLKALCNTQGLSPYGTKTQLLFNLKQHIKKCNSASNYNIKPKNSNIHSKPQSNAQNTRKSVFDQNTNDKNGNENDLDFVVNYSKVGINYGATENRMYNLEDERMKQQKKDEEIARKKAEEERAARITQQKKKEEAERMKKEREEETRKKEEDERLKRIETERMQKQKEEKERLKQIETERLKKQKAEEMRVTKIEAEKKEKERKEAIARKERKAEEEKKKIEDEFETLKKRQKARDSAIARKKAEEEQAAIARKKAEEQKKAAIARKKAETEKKAAVARKKADEEKKAAIARKKAEEEEKKRIEAEKLKKKKQNNAKKQAEIQPSKLRKKKSIQVIGDQYAITVTDADADDIWSPTAPITNSAADDLWSPKTDETEAKDIKISLKNLSNDYKKKPKSPKGSKSPKSPKGSKSPKRPKTPKSPKGSKSPKTPTKRPKTPKSPKSSKRPKIRTAEKPSKPILIRPKTPKTSLYKSTKSLIPKAPKSPGHKRSKSAQPQTPYSRNKQNTIVRLQKVIDSRNKQKEALSSKIENIEKQLRALEVKEFAVDAGLSEKRRIKITKGLRMKRLYWKTIPIKQIKGSIWEQIDDSCVDYDKRHFEAYFQDTKRNAQYDDTLDAVEQEAKYTQFPLRFVAESRAKAVLDELKALRLNNIQIRNVILNLDEKVMNVDNLYALMKLVPSVKEQRIAQREILQYGTGKVSDYGPVERLFFSLSCFDHLHLRLKLWIFKQNFDEICATIVEQYQFVRKTCDRILLNKRLRLLLTIILALGNHMNSGTSDGEQYGFDLRLLIQLTQIQSADKTQSLLMYIYDYCDKYHPNIIKLMPQLQHALKMASSVEMETLYDVYLLVKDSMQSIENLVASSEYDNYANNDRFIQVLSEFMEQSEAKMKRLTMVVSNAQIATKRVMDRFRYGSDEMRYSVESFFCIWSQFMHNFMDAKLYLMRLAMEQSDKKKNALNKRRNDRNNYRPKKGSSVYQAVEKRKEFDKYKQGIQEPLAQHIEQKAIFVANEGKLDGRQPKSKTMRKISSLYQSVVSKQYK